MTQARTGILDRRRAVASILAGRGEALLVSGLGSPSYDVFAAGDSDRNFYLWGAMGGAALVGLGLALARPELPVIVVTGDGEQLMGAGGLLTIGVQKPPNLTVIVLDNGHFGETGMQPSHTGLGLDLAAIARAAGIAHVHEIEDEGGLADLAGRIADRQAGTRFALVRIKAEEVERALPPRDGVYLKNRFRAALGLPVN